MRKHLTFFATWLLAFGARYAYDHFDPAPQTSTEIQRNYDPQQWEQITGQIFISPNPELLEIYQESLAQSQKIQIQTYEFTQKDLKTQLKSLAQFGNPIHILIENQKFQQFQNTFKILTEEFADTPSIRVRSDQHLPTTYLHSKITLLDDAFWLQTANLTQSSFFSNREHFFYSQHPGVLESLRTIFEKDREGIPLKLSDLHPNLLVCNLNCRAGIQDLLQSAKNSITIQTQYITDPQLFEILQAKDIEVQLQIILTHNTDNQKILNYFGAEKVKLSKKPYIHTKMILIDDEILLLGSMNLSANSLDNNREI